MAAPVAPEVTDFSLITDFDRAAAKFEANWLANEARKQDMIEGQRRKARKQMFKRIDKQLGLEELLK